MNGIEAALVANRIYEALVSLKLPQVEWSGVDEIIPRVSSAGGRRVEAAFAMVHSQELDVIYYPFTGFFDSKNDGTLVVKETEGWPAVLVYDADTGRTNVKTVDYDECDYLVPAVAIFHRLSIPDEQMSNCRVS